MIDINKTMNNADLIIKAAGDIPFKTTNNYLSNNAQSYGSPSITQTARGMLKPNAQDAIDGIASAFQANINSVIINTDGVSPAPISQVDRIKVTGTVNTDSGTRGKVKVDFLGFIVELNAGETAAQAVPKIVAALREPISNRLAIKSAVVANSDNTSIELTYLDNQMHELPKYSSQGLSFAQTIVSPSKPGYGTWEKLGTETKTITGQPSPVILHYFKRVA